MLAAVSVFSVQINRDPCLIVYKNTRSEVRAGALSIKMEILQSALFDFNHG